MKPKYYNPDPQAYDWAADEYDIPEIGDGEDFDQEPDQDDERERQIEARGIDADDYGWH